MKIPILILSVFFLFASALTVFCVKADQKDEISFVEKEFSSSSQEGEKNNVDDTLNEIEIIAYLNSNIYYFSFVEKQYLTAYCKIYLSPTNIFNSPPPEYV